MRVTVSFFDRTLVIPRVVGRATPTAFRPDQLAALRQPRGELFMGRNAVESHRENGLLPIGQWARRRMATAPSPIAIRAIVAGSGTGAKVGTVAV